jgi:hypothetical protein
VEKCELGISLGSLVGQPNHNRIRTDADGVINVDINEVKSGHGTQDMAQDAAGEQSLQITRRKGFMIPLPKICQLVEVLR